MQNQLMQLNIRFETYKEFVNVSDEQIELVNMLIDKALKYIKVNQTFYYGTLIHYIKKTIREDKLEVAFNAPSGLVVHLLVARDNIHWHDCGCSGLGQFTKVSEQ